MIHMTQDVKCNQDPPLFHWCETRGAGVLAHVTTLPSETGIGNLGSGARRFIEFLKNSGMSYWQICPLGPTGFGDSPYQSFSAFAGNPYLIDWEPLHDVGLITQKELRPLKELPASHVDYGKLYRVFWPILESMANRFLENGDSIEKLYGNFEEFHKSEESWLEPYSWFQTLKKAHSGKSWQNWPAKYRNYTRARESGLPSGYDKGSLLKEVFYQYLFWNQWEALKAHANESGIRIIGDIPIFVARDSCDLWSNPHFFKINGKTGKLQGVAGVPPDFFSSDGQLWGNPLYDWESMKADSYSWWMERLRINFKLYDVIRIDHFLGFQNYWEVPATAKTARKGKWKPGPGLPFFKELKARFPDARIIAEDLGELNSAVETLLEETGLPGMAVLQFAFDNPGNVFLPHNHEANKVVYTGTHDNDTSLGWYHSTSEETRDFFRRYLKVDGSQAAWDLIRAAYSSHANMAIFPIQDLMSMGSEARFNTPGTESDNWQWRFSMEHLEKLEHESAAYLKEQGWLYQR